MKNIMIKHTMRSKPAVIFNESTKYFTILFWTLTILIILASLVILMSL